MHEGSHRYETLEVQYDSKTCHCSAIIYLELSFNSICVVSNKLKSLHQGQQLLACLGSNTYLWQMVVQLVVGRDSAHGGSKNLISKEHSAGEKITNRYDHETSQVYYR